MDRAIALDELLQIWDAYVDFRKQHVSPSTVVRDYHKISRRLLLMQQNQPDLGDAKAIREWLLCNYSRDIARRTLQQLGAACKWAVFQDLLPWNPFDQLSRYLTQRNQEEESFVAFTTEERQAILMAFEESHPDDVPWVKFLFMTGCRPEEASALKWSHIARDFSEIHIREARPVDTGLTQSTKTYRATRFPCNAKLKEFLRSQRPLEVYESDYLFRSKRGGPFDYKNFQTKRWKPLITRLAEEGQIAFYMPQYNTRHTFITEALKSLDAKDVSYLCRVSVATLQRVYVSRSRSIEVPEF